MHCIDLTRTFADDMPVFPGDAPASLKQSRRVEDCGCSDHELHTGLHVGTHMDSPMHMLAGGKSIDHIPVDRFLGKGHLIDARGKKSIDASLLNDHVIGAGDIVLVCTGRSSMFGEPAYMTDYPAVTEEFARNLVRCHAGILGLDTPSPDYEPYPVHHILFLSEVLIIENLTNLEALLDVPTFDIVALPAKLAADAAPARVIAVVR